jgi:hypothetical protein
VELEELLIEAVKTNPGNPSFVQVVEHLRLAPLASQSSYRDAEDLERNGREAMGLRSVAQPSTPTAKRTYRISDSILSIEFGDIISTSADVLVSSDDYYVSMGAVCPARF